MNLNLISLLLLISVVQGKRTGKKKVPKLLKSRTQDGDPSNPGFNMIITKKGLDYVSDTAGLMLNELLDQLSVPDVKQDIENGFVEATSLHITKFIPPAYVYQVTPENQVRWGIQNAGVFVNGQWKAQKKILINVKLSGEFEANAADVSISMVSAFGRSPDGKPAVIDSRCSTTIGQLNLKIKGSFIAWVINLFKTLISKKLKPMLEDEICKKAREFILKDVNLKLQSYSPFLKLKQNMSFDLSLTSNPGIKNGFLETKHSGQISYKGLGGTPFYPHPMKSDKINDRMVNIFASDYVFNSFLFHAHRHGLTEFVVENQTFLSLTCPGGFCLGDLLPRISAKYPRNSKAVIKINTLEPPTAEFAEGKATLHADGIMQIIVIDPNGSKHSAVCASLDLTCDLKVWINDMTAVGEVDIVHFELHLINASVSLPSAEVVNSLTDLIQPLLREMANAEFRKGIPLKLTHGVNFVNPTVQFANRTLQIYTDFLYDPLAPIQTTTMESR